MDLQAMLEKCEREQWKVGDLDWSGSPRPLSQDDEVAVVQYFTDMAGIERLAAALFSVQQRKVDDPTLCAIFRTFVKDEVRHAHAAQMLADYYDVHRYQSYRTNPALVAFSKHFIAMIEHQAPDIGNAYITAGELVLDVALLRSLNEYVGDRMSQAAMDLINRDESRHIAVDFHMVGFYTSREWMQKVRAEPRPSIGDVARAARAVAGVLYHGAPFFKAVFFEPMQRVDPTGKRLAEAFKRIQLIAAKPKVRKNPFIKVMLGIQTLYNDHPLVRAAFGPVLERIAGVEGSVLKRLYTEAEHRRAQRMSFDELADEALQAKYAS